MFASQPAKGEVTWKFPCQNSRLFEYTTFAKSAGASPALGAVTQLTAHFQNLAVPGFPYLPSSVGLVKPPWKSSLVLPADVTAASYIAALNAAQGTNYDAAHYVFGTATSGKAPFSNGTLVVNGVSYGDYFFNTSVSYATPEGITNPQSYGFPQIGIDGKSLNTVSKLPAGSSGCLVKPNCPGGMIGTPAVNNGIQSYQCVCPIPTPLSGCFSYGIGIQGSLGVLAATNFLGTYALYVTSYPLLCLASVSALVQASHTHAGMLFTVLVPETNGKTLEQLNGEQEEDDMEATAAEAQADINKTQ